MIHGVQPFGRHVDYDKLKLLLVVQQQFCPYLCWFHRSSMQTHRRHASPSQAKREEHFLELRRRIFSMLGYNPLPHTACRVAREQCAETTTTDLEQD